ncbi:tripartite tricarboxylate transporter TctB family protein [Terrihabitans sp. B22-R8]|uniref:tripartite tricarboxylate transporter TctB family protein n=1 Tax=Terrihabitans sp. B22-R8 TaxID=3425128 RepID=UPI00403C89EA
MNRDMIAGSFVLLVGASAILLASRFPADGEGPASSAYFPRLVGWMICGTGALIFAQALLTREKIPEWRLRPIGMLLVGIFAFSILIGSGGLVLAAACCALIGTYAAPFTGFKQRLVTVGVITALAVVVFKVFLQLNFSVWPTWIS